MPIIGAHVSAAVSLDLSIDRAIQIGAKATQFFISPPQQWLQTNHSEKEIDLFNQKAAQFNISPNFIHGTYLINLGTQNPEHLQKSIDWLKYALVMAEKLGVQGVIFHLGSHKGREFKEALNQISKAISTILDTSNKPYLILENSAGAGDTIGDSFEELGQILKQVHSDRLKVCLDTCHAYSSGYDLKTKAGIKKTFEEFDKHIGLSNLVAIHANDTKYDLGSNKDRHENIGEGFLGKECFSNLLSEPVLQDIPFLLEVPGFAGIGPDKENIEIIKSLRS